MDNEQLKKVLAVALLVSAGAVYYFWGRADGAGLPNRIDFVCVATGEHYRIARGSFSGIPASNPDTGEETLLPAVREEGGGWRLDEFYAPLLRTQLHDVNKFVDSRTLAVRSD